MPVLKKAVLLIAVFQTIIAVNALLCVASGALEDIDFVVDFPYLQWARGEADGAAGSVSCKKSAAEPDGSIWAASSAGIIVSFPDGSTKTITGKQGLPYEDVTCVDFGPDGVFWAGTTRGVVRFDGSGWRYFAGRRWLPGDNVSALSVSADGRSVSVITDGGLGRIEQREMTLEQKALLFSDIMQARHNRDGFITDSPLRSPGDVNSFFLTDDDNDGQWTEMYLAAECFRYSATGDPQALANARRSLEAMLLLLTVSPDEFGGLPARSVLPPERCPGSDPHNWHFLPDKSLCWKNDTSVDEVVGHAFGLPIYYDLCADENEKARIASAFARMMDHIIDNGYRIVGVDGKTTSDGHFEPEWVNRGPGPLGDQGLNSAEILNALISAHHITGDEKYLEHYKNLVKEHNYHRNVREWKSICDRNQINHDSYEMGYLSFYNLLRYEKNEKLRSDYYLEGLRRSHVELLPNRNAEQIVIFGAFARKDYGLDAAVQTLRELPLDLVKHSVFNSVRADVKLSPKNDRFRSPQMASILPYEEARTIRWSENMLALDADDGGRSEAMAQFFLLPYWMARHHGMIVPQAD